MQDVKKMTAPKLVSEIYRLSKICSRHKFMNEGRAHPQERVLNRMMQEARRRHIEINSIGD